MIFVERKYCILTIKIGYTFLQDTLYILFLVIILFWKTINKLFICLCYNVIPKSTIVLTNTKGIYKLVF